MLHKKYGYTVPLGHLVGLVETGRCGGVGSYSSCIVAPRLWEAMLSGQTGAQPPRHQLLTCSMIVTAADVMRPGLTVDVLFCAFVAREQSGRGRAASL